MIKKGSPYVSIYYCTPQLVREQQLKSKLTGQLQKAASKAKAKESRKKDV